MWHPNNMLDFEYALNDEVPVVVSKHTGFRLLEIRGRQFVDFREPNYASMRDYITSYLDSEVDDETIEDFAHRYPVTFLMDYIHLLERMGHRDQAPLLSLLKEAKQKRKASYAKRKEKGMVEMGDVETIYPNGTEVVCQTGDDGIIGGIVKQIKIQQSWFSGPFFEVKLAVIHAVKGEVTQGFYIVRIPGFHGLVKAETLPIRVPTDEDRKKLTQRGKLFAEFWKPGTYAAYKGVLLQPSWWSTRTFRADGRVVIDPISFERQEPEIWQDCVRRCGVNIDRDDDRTPLNKKVEIAVDDYWRCLPVLYGFSLAVKQWGRLDLDGMSPIKWRDDAWDKLVVDADEKDMIHSLVKFHGTGFTDIIEGKGGGCIFLLHGPPGWGKTASAEAVAELLHKPLYSVGVGELGVDTETLEAKLRAILDVATIWDAVLLLDEADIFLEERDDHNIARNAMVGVFLRLLEYHNGVLFLTTNRVKNIDKAFYSRISVALHYTPEGKSHKIWTNLLGAAGLNPAWADDLSEFGVNGRQIKNSIRMAQTLARAKGREVELGDLTRSVKAALRFETEMAAKRNPDAITKPRARKKPSAKATAA
jgi:hypothetical protein